MSTTATIDAIKIVDILGAKCPRAADTGWESSKEGRFSTGAEASKGASGSGEVFGAKDGFFNLKIRPRSGGAG